MRSGDLGKALGVSGRTIANWTMIPDFQRFLSEESRGYPNEKGEPTSHRRFTEEDLIVLNTIKTLKNNSNSWTDVAAQLATGYRDDRLPATAALIKSASPAEQVLLVLEIKKDLALAIQRAENAEAQLDRLRSLDKEKDDLIASLNREIGKWKAEAELYKQFLKAEQE